MERSGLDQQRSHDQGHDRHELDENIHRRSGCVFKGIAHRIADDRSLMRVRSFAPQISGLDVLLGIVPSASTVRHHDGK